MQFRSAWRLLVLILTCSALGSPAHADDDKARLPRRALLGLKLAPVPPGIASGALVEGVLPGLTADRLGVRAGDRISSAGGKPTTGPKHVAAYAGSLVAGELVSLGVVRDGRAVAVRGRALARPEEHYAGAITRYGAVPFGGGLLRDILVTPASGVEEPVVMLVQGFTCGSVESPDPDDTYRRLTAQLVGSGIAVYRVEKPGVGDSAGGRRCVDINFATELAAFATAYAHLTESHGHPPDRVFLLGHSMGGLQAPLLAARRPPRGIAVYGTVVRNWADYHFDLERLQAFHARGADPAEQAADAERHRELLRLFYLQRQSPAAIASARPDLADGLRSVLDWDGGERIMAGEALSVLAGLGAFAARGGVAGRADQCAGALWGKRRRCAQRRGPPDDRRHRQPLSPRQRPLSRDRRRRPRHARDR